MEKTATQIIAIMGTAMILSILLYYYVGGATYVRAFGVAVPQFVKGVENFQSSYPKAA